MVGPCEVKYTQATLDGDLFVERVLMDDPQAEHWFGHGRRLEKLIGWRIWIKNIAIVLIIKVKRTAVELPLIEAQLNGGPELLLLIDGKWPTQTQLHFVGLKLTVADLIMEIIDCIAPLFPFRIGSNGGGLKGNTDAAPLGAVVGCEAEVFFEIASVGRVLKNGVVVELRPMDVLG